MTNEREREMAAKWLKEQQPCGSMGMSVRRSTEKLLAEYAAWRDAQAWHAIEGAPKDKVILLGNKEESAEGWRSRDHCWYADGDEFKGATHWRPLPEPPK